MLKCFILFSVISLTFGSPTKHRPTLRIIGGKDASIDDVPYHLAILDFSDVFYCSAALVTQKFALTTGNCAYDAFLPYIGAGSANVEEEDQVILVSKSHTHPKFSRYTNEYDIAVLELEQPVTSRHAAPIALVEANATLEDGQMGIVSGWGYVTADGTETTQLQSLDLPLISNEKCNEGYFGLVSDRMMCAGFFDEGGKDACYEDDGGPLVVDGVLVGLVSWGFGCGKIGYPSVYTNLANPEIAKFIRDTIGL